MSERLIFSQMSPKTTTKSVCFDTRLMPLDLYIESSLSIGLIFIECKSHRDIKITARCFFAMCAAAQPRSLEGTLPKGGAEPARPPPL